MKKEEKQEEPVTDKKETNPAEKPGSMGAFAGNPFLNKKPVEEPKPKPGEGAKPGASIVSGTPKNKLMKGGSQSVVD